MNGRTWAAAAFVVVAVAGCGSTGTTASAAKAPASSSLSSSPSPSASPTPTKYEQFAALATSRGVPVTTQQGEVDSVARNLCDNSKSDFDLLMTALKALPDFQARYTEQTALMDVYCPGKTADLTQAKLRADQHTVVPADIKLEIKVLKQSCFGSAGCNVTYRIVPSYVGPGSLGSGSYEITYSVTGDEDGPQINTFTIDSGQYSVDSETLASTKSSKTVLTATVTEVTAKSS